MSESKKLPESVRKALFMVLGAVGLGAGGTFTYNSLTNEVTMVEAVESAEIVPDPAADAVEPLPEVQPEPVDGVMGCEEATRIFNEFSSSRDNAPPTAEEIAAGAIAKHCRFDGDPKPEAAPQPLPPEPEPEPEPELDFSEHRALFEAADGSRRNRVVADCALKVFGKNNKENRQICRSNLR